MPLAWLCVCLQADFGRDYRMGFIKKFLITRQAVKISDMAAEEEIYEHVNDEIESGISQGLWVKATTSASSSEYEDIKREYIRLRVERLHAEGKLYSQIASEVSESIEPEATDFEQEVKKEVNTKISRAETIWLIFFFVSMLAFFVYTFFRVSLNY